MHKIIFFLEEKIISEICVPTMPTTSDQTNFRPVTHRPVGSNYRLGGAHINFFKFFFLGGGGIFVPPIPTALKSQNTLFFYLSKA